MLQPVVNGDIVVRLPVVPATCAVFVLVIYLILMLHSKQLQNDPTSFHTLEILLVVSSLAS